jgi:hypothetical protein
MIFGKKPDDSAKIVETAQELIDQHGEKAPDVAIGQASRMEKSGNTARRTEWLRIMISAQQMLVSRQGW